MMNIAKHAAPVSLLALAVGATSARAQTNNAPWVELEATSVMAGVGEGSGDGQLHLPNLGTNCDYPFAISGFGAGVHVGVTKISASGPAKNLTKLDDFRGTYTSSQGEVTLGVGRGDATLKNKANDVIIEVAAQTAGIGLGVSGQGLTIDMPIPPENAPRAYVLEYGFQKGWLNADNRKALNGLVDAWKCRFVNDVTGGSDSQETEGAKLASLRANAVRNYLVGAGVAANRITPKASDYLRVLTSEGVRLRQNRVVVVTIR
jgi:hypothetical protein